MSKHTYRKKSVTIKAFQTGKGCWAKKVDRPKWLNAALDRPPGSEGSVYAEDICEGRMQIRVALAAGAGFRVYIGTKTFATLVPTGYWIVKKPSGDLAVIDPDSFAELYEKA